MGTTTAINSNRGETLNEVERYSRDQLIEMYLPLIRTVACALASRLPSCVDADDLTGVGVMGLIDAVEKYDHAKCDSFKNYARIRIKGAMLDELRSLDWVQRSVRQVAAQLDRERTALEHALGRGVTGAELAQSMGLDMPRYHQLRDRTGGPGMVSFEDIGADSGEEQRSFLECVEDSSATAPDDQTNRSKIRTVLEDAIASLSKRQRLVIGLYYVEELNLKEIGSILGVTESRVSQIHTRAVKTLRQRMKSMYGIDLIPIAA
jgi:RNA polymerase sigma factor for flagellar operon FliA